MMAVSLRRSSLPVVLFVIVAAILILFLLGSHDSSSDDGVIRRRWRAASRGKPLNDKFKWTTTNCHAGMTMLVEMCPCVAEVDITQKQDKVATAFVDCIYECVEAEGNFTDEDYDLGDDDDSDDEEEDKDDRKVIKKAVGAGQKTKQKKDADEDDEDEEDEDEEDDEEEEAEEKPAAAVASSARVGRAATVKYKKPEIKKEKDQEDEEDDEEAESKSAPVVSKSAPVEVAKTDDSAAGNDNKEAVVESNPRAVGSQGSRGVRVVLRGGKNSPADVAPNQVSRRASRKSSSKL